jgi:hypothetical protein
VVDHDHKWGWEVLGRRDWGWRGIVWEGLGRRGESDGIREMEDIGD